MQESNKNLEEIEKEKASGKKTSKPAKPNKLRKCGVCKETILGPFRSAGEEVYHNFVRA